MRHKLEKFLRFLSDRYCTYILIIFSDLNCSTPDSNASLKDLFSKYKVRCLKDPEAGYTRIGSSNESYLDYFLTVGVTDH